ncbi:MAG UNVERIFIED_CONTAM: transposase [Planctomycetaceae bacterium]
MNELEQVWREWIDWVQAPGWPLRRPVRSLTCRRRDSMKAIFRDGDGFVIWYKRHKRGTWQLIPASPGEPRRRGC